MLIPVGFAHGVCTLEPDTEIMYKVTNFYSPAHDFGIRWNDPDLNIAWPFASDQMLLSDKDRQQPLLKEAKTLF
jgi:dTDP-4-dehydrorhamnose 3,5-epimerase